MLLGETTKARNVLECGHAFASYHCRDCRHDTRLRLSCFLRLCPRCATRRRLTWIDRHAQALDAIKNPTLLTLTFISIPTLTPDAITHATTCFARLRRLKLWSEAVSGGMSGLEITWSPNGWHLHFHALLDATWISRHPISHTWKRITGGAWLVDIRRCDVYAGVREVAKYIAKGSTFYASPSRLHQFLTATKGRRFFSTFGSFYKLSPGNTPPPPDTKTSPPPDILNPQNFHGPTPQKCQSCGSPHLIAMGKVLDDPLDPPPIQIPF